MTSVIKLRSGWHVDQAIVREEERIVCIRFGVDGERETLLIDSILEKISVSVSQWCAIYSVDISKVVDFNDMYELEVDECVLMIFYRNRHVMVDIGSGDNNKIGVVKIERSRDALIELLEKVYRGARKGQGLVTV